MDHPAAHSMDTTWFAMDEEGQLAAMHSGESGAVPASVERGSEDRWEEALEALLPRSLALRLAVVTPGEHAQAELFERSTRPSLILHLAASADAACLGEQRSRMPWLGSAAWRAELDGPGFRALHEAGGCEGCEPGWRRSWLGRLAQLGLYVFDHDLTENWASGPYDPAWRPSKPARLDLLPEALQRALVPLPLRFAARPRIQPILYERCDSHQLVWLDSDMQTLRPLLEDEDEAWFRERYGARPGWRLRFEPPSYGETADG